MISKSRYKAFVGGNIGTPLTDYLLSREPADCAVLEVSSFQLDIMDSFSPDIAILLNISPDHLDRYESYDDYVASKLKIVAQQKEDQFAILNNDDELLRNTEPSGHGKVLRYGLESGRNQEAFVEGERVFAQIPGRKPGSFSLTNFNLPGSHNRGNLMAGVLAGMVLDLDQDCIQRSIDEFKGLSYRLEWLRKINNVDYYNDSKATNIDAALKAIKSFNRPIVLIAGGRHKGADYFPLVEGARGLVKQVVLLGEARELLEKAFRNLCPCTLVEDMQQAVEMAASLAQPGDVVLLAPACSSFDMFQDYVQRGEVFKSIVEGLSDGQ
jgi:UDP-N-acetylmuramoylalanine--D-glutamate ligase